MTIILNGEKTPISGDPTVADLLTTLELAAQRVAIELNEQLVRRAQYDATPVRDGDRIEIVTLVGGG